MKEYIIKVDEQKTDIDGGMPLQDKPQELIRCRDCKHGYTLTDSAYVTCGRRFHDGQKHEADWFCADGVKKDDVGEFLKFKCERCSEAGQVETDGKLTCHLDGKRVDRDGTCEYWR